MPSVRHDKERTARAVLVISWAIEREQLATPAPVYSAWPRLVTRRCYELADSAAFRKSLI